MIRILAVDDHEVLLSLICRRLDAQSDIIIEGSAQNGKIALDLLNSGLNVDVLLTDFNMPIMDGLQLAQHISVQYPQIKVVVLTMNTTPDVLNRFKKIGVKAVLSKDIDLEDLLVIIRTLQ